MWSRGGEPVRVKVTAQDYDGKPVQTQVHVDRGAGEVGFGDAPTIRNRGGRQRCDHRRGRNGAGGPGALAGSGDFEVTASAQTPEQRTVEGRTWVWIWNGAGEWYQRQHADPDCRRQEELPGGRHCAPAARDGPEGVVGRRDGGGQ